MSVSPSVPVTSTRHSKRRLVAAAGIAVGGLVLTGGGVLAGLNATAFNTTAQTVGSGTLQLVLSNNGAGFTTAVNNLAPGDTVNRYVNLANSGTLDATALTLKVTDTTATNTKLTTDAGNGLNVTVSTCPTAWSASAGTCASTATSVFSTPVATLKTTASTVAASVAAGGNAFLKVSLVLPDQNETTTNGTPPTSTIQGLSATLVFTFNEVQRAATTTNS